MEPVKMKAAASATGTSSSKDGMREILSANARDARSKRPSPAAGIGTDLGSAAALVGLVGR